MNSLTSREREIVLTLAEGLSNKDVGRKLSLSEGTVKVHLHNIYSKFRPPDIADFRDWNHWRFCARGCGPIPVRFLGFS